MLKLKENFERAAINVIEQTFPLTTQGCFFYFTQCFYRKVVELGLKQQYEEQNGEFAH